MSSCSGEDACSDNNTGTLVFENTNSNATLQISLNQEFGSVNGPGDLSVAPGETQSISSPAGPQTVYARFSQSICVNGRCSISVTGLDTRATDLDTCESATLAY